MKRLTLKSESLVELTATEMDSVGGAAELITGACVTTSALACYSVRNCPTNGCPTWGYCTGTAIC